LSYIPGDKIISLPKDTSIAKIARIIAEPTPNPKIILPPLPPDEMPVFHDIILCRFYHYISFNDLKPKTVLEKNI